MRFGNGVDATSARNYSKAQEEGGLDCRHAGSSAVATGQARLHAGAPEFGNAVDAANESQSMPGVKRRPMACLFVAALSSLTIQTLSINI